ncbi:hypothetical protein B0I35DRAFT_483464 [Stachybotrys elegans]|uniref:Gmp synthase n=1 Tax=Stachybotrys elegans TaxID=80388 RepID=A0A8K0SLM8_9HYPO|nr:hypothetical protein B0I35DRAFT_483464 [Stachybotrys elegans]
MSKYKDIMKNGWHPEKSGSGSGTGIRGQVSGLMGRNKSSDSNSNHVAQPLSSLRDPSEFAPPPRRTSSGLTQGPRPDPPAPSKYHDPRSGSPIPPPPTTATPGYGSQEQGTTDAPAPRGPYRVNTTGLSTDNLPRPPARRDGADGRTPPPPSYESAIGAAPAAKPAPPRLPPRLPPRAGSGSSTPVQTPSTPEQPVRGMLNQGAINRLGAAGVSVPGLGIGPSQPNSNVEPSPMSPLPSPRVGANMQVNELQNRFSKLGTSSGPPPSEGTTWAQKQAALKTASSFQKDPSSVSLADARAAASTASNFHQRHGHQVAAGLQSANNLNQRYGVADKVGGVMESQGQGQASPVLAGLAGKKKPPPPPPSKRKPAIPSPASASPQVEDDVPPPIPMSTRPTF